MASLSSDLTAHLEGTPTQQIAQKLGISPVQASAAIGTALPLLLGAMGHNASQPQGAQALYGALQKDHAGQDVGTVLGSVLGGGGQGSGILAHVFGSQQPRAAEAVGQTTGIGQDKAHTLLRWLAPVAMAYLAKRMFDHRQDANAGTPTANAPTPTPASTSASDNASASSPGVLSDVLAPEARHAQQGGLLDAVLGDGGFGDLLRAGRSILGGAAAATNDRPSP